MNPFLQFFFCLVLLLSSWVPALAAKEPAVAGLSHEEAMQLGRRMYLEGILPSGKPMQATVMGDIPVDGRAFTCDDCHQRSGLGSEEGTVITWPINGKYLAEPRRRSGAWRPPDPREAKITGRGSIPPQYRTADVRPAYTDETLAGAIVAAEAPSGAAFDPVMPRYSLDDRDLAILVYYLKNLNLTLSPGVDKSTIRFATVVTEGVPDDKRAAMLSTLRAHIDARNSQSRHEERRSRSGPFYKSEMYQAYRRLELAVWELKGPAETWRSQLETYHQTQPVFALLGGISSGSWTPIHRFCEEREIPALFPITDLPVISDSDWFTLYFSKGLYQEGEAVAKYLFANKIAGGKAKILQIFRKKGKNAAVARGFAETWKGLGMPPAADRVIGQGEEFTPRIYKEMTESFNPEVVLFWLDQTGLAVLDQVDSLKNMPDFIFASWSLLGKEPPALSKKMRDKVYLSYPFILPQETGKRLDVVRTWLRARKIPVTDLEIQSKMYFLGWMLSGAIKAMRSDFYRDHFLEGFDMMIDQDYAIPVYPRLTFGPGQRYAAKGCYIVQLAEGENPELVKRSDWIVY